MNMYPMKHIIKQKVLQICSKTLQDKSIDNNIFYILDILSVFSIKYLYFMSRTNLRYLLEIPFLPSDVFRHFPTFRFFLLFPLDTHQFVHPCESLCSREHFKFPICVEHRRNSARTGRKILSKRTISHDFPFWDGFQECIEFYSIHEKF